MPITINEILSDVINEVNDIALERITQGELVDITNNVARDIAEWTRIYINRYIAVPNPILELWQDNTSYSLFRFVIGTDGNYYMSITSHLSSTTTQPITGANWALNWMLVSQWAVATVYAIGDIVWSSINGKVRFFKSVIDHTSSLADQPPDPLTWTEIASNGSSVYTVSLPFLYNTTLLAPYKLIRVVRGTVAKDVLVNGLVVHTDEGWTECYEFSQQSIGATISGNNSFDVNNTQLDGSHFLVQMANEINVVDSGLHLIFGEAFEPDEQCVIDFISGYAFDNQPFTRWDYRISPAVSIPEFLRDAFKWGIQSKVARRFYMRGDNEWRERAEKAEELYDGGRQANHDGGYLRKAADYARNLKDTKSVIQTQPINWYAE